MRWAAGRRLQGARARRIALAIAVVAAGILALALIARIPRAISATGMLDQCLWGWPVVILEGEERQIPVADWPSGLRFDEAAGALLDARGAVVFRKGDRIRIAGTIVETTGDPAPCFYTVGVRITSITAP